MKFQLILQFSDHSFDDFAQMMAVGEALALYLHGLGEVDGHDSGSGQINIFPFTNQPTAAFEKAKFIVNAAGLMTSFAAAYRLVEGDELIRLWPIGAAEPFRVI